MYRGRCETLKEISIGDLLTATVKEVTEMGAILGGQGGQINMTVFVWYLEKAMLVYATVR